MCIRDRNNGCQSDDGNFPSASTTNRKTIRRESGGKTENPPVRNRGTTTMQKNQIDDKKTKEKEERKTKERQKVLMLETEVRQTEERKRKTKDIKQLIQERNQHKNKPCLLYTSRCV